MNNIKPKNLLQCEEKILLDVFFHNFPGGKINATKLASQYNVSTSVCREALHRLVGKEVICVKQNVGFFVNDKMNLDSVVDIHNFYLDISSEICKSIFDNIDNKWLAKLHYLLSMWSSLANDCESLIQQILKNGDSNKSLFEKFKQTFLEFWTISREFWLALFENTSFGIKQTVYSYEYLLLNPFPKKYEELGYIEKYLFPWYKKHTKYIESILEHLSKRDFNLFHEAFINDVEHRILKFTTTATYDGKE